MRLRFTFLLPVLLAGVAVAQVSDVTLRGVMPPPPPGVNATVIGTPGAAVRCYFVEAIYPGGNVVNGQFPACVFNAANTLTGSNFVNVGWTPVTGATGYNIIVQTATGVLPASCSSCVVAANTTATSVADNGGALTNYTATGFANPSPTSTLRINNTLYATPRVELTLWPFQIISGNLYLGAGGGAGGILHQIASITGTLDNTVLAFTDNASAVNFHTIVNSATGNPLQLTATGTDTNIGLSTRPKGTGSWDVTTGGGVQFRVTNTPSAVNFFSVSGTGTGVGPTFAPVGSDASIPLNLASKSTAAINLLTNGNPQFRVIDTAGTIINLFTVTGAATAAPPTFAISTTTDANVGMLFTPKGTGAFNITPTTNTNPTASFPGVASAINGWVFTPGATGTAPSFGIGTTSDTNVGMTFTAKGVGPWIFNTQTANNNGLTVTPGATTVAPIISVNGTDSNVPIAITPKGTLNVVSTGGFVQQFGNTTAADTITLTVAQIMGVPGGGAVLTGTPTAPANYTLPSAALICAALFPGVGTAAGATGGGASFEFYIRNTSGGANTITVLAGASDTLTGTATIAQNAFRMFRAVALSTPCTTVQVFALASGAF